MRIESAKRRMGAAGRRAAGLGVPAAAVMRRLAAGADRRVVTERQPSQAPATGLAFQFQVRFERSHCVHDILS
jgi:hypothetical protein